MMNLKVIGIRPLVFVVLLLWSTCDTKGQSIEFDRAEILQHLKAKIAAGKPLVAHVLVPLCDNENQGIVPVNASLGNGQNPRSNLYWGAGYGVKTHFKRTTGWELVGTEVPTERYLLDRAVFRKTYSNGTEVILIADAYDGAHMERCLQDFLASLSGAKSGCVTPGNAFSAWGDADLIAFNGHNGLMDMQVSTRKNTDGRRKDAVVIACASHDYFKPHLASAGGYPLLTTTNLLAPEAYVIRNVIDAWAQLKSGAEVRAAAGRAYNQYQKCGLKGATRLFHSGW